VLATMARTATTANRFFMGSNFTGNDGGGE